MSPDVFTAHRDLLVGVAYRLLGSMTDAEDVVQDAWLRWSGVDQEAVANPQAYLITVTTRLAIDRMRRVRARREAYVGPWLPEPVSTAPDAAEHAELADSVEIALLVVLETLSPLERAVFVLHEAFGLPLRDIAGIIGREPAATRQLARRARDHIEQRRPRFEVDRARRREMTERFLAACGTGDLHALTELLATDVRLVSDGGGRAKAPLRVIHGVDKVARFLNAVSTEAGVRAFLASLGESPTLPLGVAVTDVNGAPAVVVSADGRPVTILSLVVRDGLIDTVYLFANPEKLAAMSHRWRPGASEGA
ncbi:RNA polymerase sigma factor SigJ [Micromonospora sp. WMMD1082]|uniref:RNA polymerase sigma factor SigJ n=1 Tax=Micromonospora sp. WMMD1082 TaxID=3016104 RepID=UPI002417FB2B|nr:RNA polymerase sigma factor SigJ [Micromonospora sp. WMMD1082]MDG4798115.1 RNA polymerase sigma factor SigJ [Micromonospora sp. WMMD1082]